jgi:hypothetical protein
MYLQKLMKTLVTMNRGGRKVESQTWKTPATVVETTHKKLFQKRRLLRAVKECMINATFVHSVVRRYGRKFPGTS